ncbi:uncharacterized protein [Periplaneta americana]|uniref:uncharacterized protein isoform X2 n=1 Tax=Periplaneta americana TaxID=6978 RepID=UPI0037E9AB19
MRFDVWPDYFCRNKQQLQMFNMQLRKKVLFMIFLAMVFMILIVFQLRISTVTNDDQFSEYKQKYYIDGLNSWYNYSSSTSEDLNLPSVHMDDPRVISRIRRKFIVSPSPQAVPYKLDKPLLFDTSMGQAEKIISILKQQREGFFIECGALDGETRSNTLVFERHLNWSGLLIEADPLNFAKMVTKNRKAYLSPTCLSIKPYPMMVSFKQAFNVGKISDNLPGYKEQGYVDVQCFPLYSYLLALNRTTVDYFSLDVEGNELEVLRTIPFEKLDIRTLSVEYIHVEEGKDVLRKFMEKQGYTLHSEVTHDNNLANDFIFVKSSLAAELDAKLL